MKPAHDALSLLIFLFTIFFLPLSVFSWPVPDTGQTKCYDAEKEIPCPQPGEPFYGQDGNYNINLPSFTKLDANGTDLNEDASEWVMVRDNITGLIWENKTINGVQNDINNPRFWANVYTWYDSSLAENQGYSNSESEEGNTEEFLDSMNAFKIGEYSDWRLPTAKELGILLHTKAETNYFPHKIPSIYWSSNSYAENLNQAWGILPGQDYDILVHVDKDTAFHARAIRGNAIDSMSNKYTVNSNGTIVDNFTGLIWQKETAGPFSWEEALSYCEGLGLNGDGNWRLPNINELISVIDFSNYSPAINNEIFLDTESDEYWSSSTYDGSHPAMRAIAARSVNFRDGASGANFKTHQAYVRAVHGGTLEGKPSELPALSITKTIPIENGAFNISTYGKYAYVQGTSEQGPIYIFDLNQPENPKHKNTMLEDYAGVNISASNGYLYTAGEYCFDYECVSTLNMFDLDDPLSPMYSNSINTNAWPSDLYIFGSNAFVGIPYDHGGVDIFDVSNPSSPIFLANTNSYNNEWGWIRTILFDPSKKDNLYAVTRTTCEEYYTEPNVDPDACTDNILQIFDITKPQYPKIIGKFNFKNKSINDIALSENILFLSYRTKYDWKNNSFIENSGGIEIININNPENLQHKTTIQTQDVTDLYVNNSYLFALSSDLTSLLHIFDISSPESPINLDSVEIPGMTSSFLIYDSYAYIVGEQGLHVVDLSSHITSSSITPEIAQRPLAGPIGTTFTQWGTGFTKNSTATLHFFDETGEEIGTDIVDTKADGSFEVLYTAENYKALGKYTWYAVDDTTGSRTQDEITYEIIATPYPEISNNPQHGTLYTEFEQIGTGFTPNTTATLYFFDDSGQSLGTEKVDIQADGTFKIPYNPPDNKALGRYYWYAIDNSTGNQTLEVEYWIEEGENQSPDIVHYPPIIAEPGKNLTITAKITDSTNYVKAVSIFYRNPGVIRDSDEPKFITYTNHELSSGDETFELKEIIPRDVLTNNGIEYYIEAVDDNDAMSSVGSSEIPIFVPAGFIWQKISIEQEVYTVSIIADEVPENPKEYVYPLFDGSSDAKKYEPKAIYITDPNNEIIADNDLQKKILSLARNTAIYRLWAKMDTDPIPILTRDSSPAQVEKVNQTPPIKGCCNPISKECLIDRGNTDTSFGADYPGHLVFPIEYIKDDLVYKLVDWEKGWENFCPGLYGSDRGIYPQSLMNFDQRKEIYKKVLRHIVLQDGAGIEQDDILETIRLIIEALKLYGGDEAVNLAMEFEGLVDKIIVHGNSPDAIETAFKNYDFSKKQIETLGKVLGNIEDYKEIANKSSLLLRSLSNFGEVMGYMGLIKDIVEIPGVVLEWNLIFSLMYAHGFEILNNTLTALQEADGIDNALSTAIIELRLELDDETLRQFQYEMINEILVSLQKVTLDGIQIVATKVGASMLASGNPVGLGVLIANVAVTAGRGIHSWISNKIENEELHQAVIILATLENAWYNHPMKKDLDELANADIASDGIINKLNWNVSTRLYEAIFVTDKIFKEETKFVNKILAGKEKKEILKKMEEFNIRLLNHMKGNIDENAEKGDMLNRISGRPLLNGNFIGFVPQKELNELLNKVENPEASRSEIGIKYTLSSPGEVGIIDPVGRRCGAFVSYEENGEQKIIEINEIPGAHFSRNSHSKEIYTPISATGDSKIKLTGTGNGAYTLSVQETFGDSTIISENHFTGEFEKGKTEDALINITDDGITIKSKPKARGIITGTIINNITGNPVDGAYISVDTKGAVSDSDGKFEISDIEPKEYFIKVEAESFQSYISEIVNLSPKENINIEVKLTPVYRYYFDNDGDGLGNPETMIEATSKPDGFVENADDSNDLLPEAPSSENLTVDAGPDQTVNERTKVSLVGSAENATEQVSYSWSQTDGTAVQLNNATTSTPYFIASDVSEGNVTLTFLVTATDSTGAQATDACNIVVINIDSELENTDSNSTSEGPGDDDHTCFISATLK